MRRKAASLVLFLSPPCKVENNRIITPSSWYRFIMKFGLPGDTLNIVCPPLDSGSNNFTLISGDASIKQTELFQFNSIIGYYARFTRELYHTFVKYLVNIRKSDAVIFRIPCPGFCIVSLMCALFRKPLVVFIGGNMLAQSDTYNTSRGLTKIALRLVLAVRVYMHKISLKYADHIFSVSNDALKLYGLTVGDSVELMRTPVFAKAQINESFEPVQYSGLGPLKLIRACWLQPSKGLENLIQAVYEYSKTENIELDIFGEARDELYKRKLVDLVASKKLERNVRFLGWVTQDKIQDLYAKYHLHVMSSLSEGTPRVCLEASASAVPQIMTPVGGVLDFYEHMIDAYITVDCSAVSILKGIEWFSSNSDVGREQGIKARSNAIYNSLEAKACRVNHVLTELLNY